MKENKYISAVIETTLELDCDKEYIEHEDDKFVLELKEDGSFEYIIRQPKYNSDGVIIDHVILERGNIGVGLTKLIRKYINISDIIERLSVESFHDIIIECEEMQELGYD